MPMKKWDKSGEQNPNRSPSDFIDDSVSHPKVVKYMCLLFQGNKDLLDFSSKLMPAGVAKDSGAGRVKLQHGAAYGEASVEIDGDVRADELRRRTVEVVRDLHEDLAPVDPVDAQPQEAKVSRRERLKGTKVQQLRVSAGDT